MIRYAPDDVASHDALFLPDCEFPFRETLKFVRSAPQEIR